MQNQCEEVPQLLINDGSHSIYLSTWGENKEEVPPELVKFLDYVRAGLDESTRDFEDPFVKSLQKAVLSVKESREMEAYYMVFKEMLYREHSAGKAEGKAEDILDLLEGFDVSDELVQKIMAETDLDVLKRWHKLAAKSESIEQFVKEM